MEKQNRPMDTSTVTAAVKIPSNKPQMGFHHLSLSHSLEQGSVHYGPQAKSGLPPIFTNKVLLEDIFYTYLFIYCLRLPSCYSGRAE